MVSLLVRLMPAAAAARVHAVTLLLLAAAAEVCAGGGAAEVCDDFLALLASAVPVSSAGLVPYARSLQLSLMRSPASS